MTKTGGRWVDVGALADLPPGKVARSECAGRVLALVNVDGVVHAVDAVCPHQGGPLEQGTLWQGKLQCPWHFFLFDLTTGANAYPANVYPEDMPVLKAQLAPLEVFPVRVEDGRILVQVSDDL
jgi:nitrite reductase/ring-hydroxylating ferredoxin subunit